ncbi:CU044_2847 family protein [Micromonospora sp. DT47]|uniref:CU044_2847 family protein n=1 Tax=Micromonospora sp. DT47 TaxID=3393431 RepID=UPI003CE97ED3
MSAGDLVEVALPDGEILYVEIEVPVEGDIAWRGQKVAWCDLQEQVARVSKWVIESVRAGLPDTPKRVGVEFGLKITGETGTLVGALAKAGAESSIVVRLEWER